MGNSKLANGCQAASGADAPAAPSLNGILAQVPGDRVAAARLTLVPPSATGPLHQEVEVDAGHVGRVRLFFEQKIAPRPAFPPVLGGVSRRARPRRLGLGHPSDVDLYRPHGRPPIRERAVEDRKAALREVLDCCASVLLYVQDVEDGQGLYQRALALGLEGVVGKRLGSAYQCGKRSPDWVKMKRPGGVPAERFRR